MMTDYKEKDRNAILGYLKERNSVKVTDIIAHAGAEEMRVYPILFELEREGIIRVEDSDDFGAAEVVALMN